MNHEKFSGVLLLAVVLIVSPSVFAQTVDCVVENEESSSASGSLGEKMGILNPPSPPDCSNHTITFADGVNDIEISSTGSIIQNSAVINGGGDVSIATGADGLSALMIIGADKVTIQNLTAINKSTNTAFPTVITQDETMTNTAFSGVSFSAAGVNVQLESGLNLVTQCNFEFTQAALSDVLGASATRPLVKINGLLEALSSPSNFQARLSGTDIAQWTLTGEVDSTANRVEIYTVDAAAKTVRFLEVTTASNGAFSFTFTMPATLPNQTFAFLGMNNTTGSFQMSQFSSAFTPTTDDSAFYSDAPACEDVTWLVAAQGGLTGDFDGDGLTNGTEDADADCTVDSTETHPAAADTDGDTVADNTDNCKLTSNLSQADADNNGVGDACTDTDSDGVFDDTDNCESTTNATQADADADGIGDACEAASVAAGGGTTTDTATADDTGATSDSGTTTTAATDSGGGCTLAPGAPAAQLPAMLAMLGLWVGSLFFARRRH